ncbi:MAG TPA: DNRLRE domain-containing protein [Kineosporiaceae bacterium]|nr:DNRLRE domain-containing protein [Kineosporiaceae bacterium]
MVVPARTVGVAAVIAVLGLGVSLAVPAQASPQVAGLSAARAAAKPAPVVAKDDRVSARIAAKTQNRAVEVVGSRTESSTTWALPNGQLRTDSNPAPVRVERADGSWTSIDLTLVAGKSGWKPKSSPRPVTFSAGGDGPAVLFTRRGRSLSMGWDGALPKPVIAGATATYALDATRDLVLTARPDGFEQSVVIKDRPAAGETVDPVELPLSLDGADAVKVKGGGVTFEATETTGKGEAKVKAGDEVFAIQAPVMYSAATDAKTGEHTQVTELPQKLVQDPEAGVDAGLTLTPDQDFLSDPKTVFPVTIDPVISAVDAIGDSWVRNGDNAVHGAEDHLNAGLWTSSSQNSSALIKFDDEQYKWNHVTSASLNLFNSYSGSCTENWVGVYPISEDWNPATVTYDTSPGMVDDDKQLWRQFSHGFDASCPATGESFDMTSAVRAWAWDDLPNYGFMIFADTNGPDGRKSFCSLDVGTTGVCSDPARVPTLSVTYNSYPWDPREVTASPQVTGSNGTTYVTSLTPNLQAKIGNTDGANVSVQGQISYDPNYPGDGNGEFWFGEGSAATPNSLASVSVDTPLTTGKHYRYRVRGGVIDGSGGTDTGPWSDYTYFTVDNSPPVAPTIACTTYPANAWTNSSASSTCTLDTTSGGGSGYWWGLDNPSPETFLNDSSNSGAPLTVSISPGEGRHVLYAKSRDVALNTSTTTTTYTFGVGNGGVLTPVAYDTTQKAVGLTAQSSSARTQVTYSYRPGTDASLSWITVPPANVTPAGSTTAITGWPRPGTVSGSVANYSQLNWNAAATIAAAGGTNGAIQVRACFTQAGANQWCSVETTFILAKTDFAGSSATSPFGPGVVSLVTGNFDLTVPDISIGGLSIARDHSSLTPAPASNGPDGVFGPGWRIADFGSGDGSGDLTLTDSSANGYVTLRDATGTEFTYSANGGVFAGTGDSDDGSTLKKSTTISNPADSNDNTVYTGWQLTSAAGDVTTFLAQAGSSGVYLPKWVDGVGKENESAYSRDSAGRVTKILAPVPAGVTCASMVAGCRALNLTYATSTTATGTGEAAWGDVTGRVKVITYTAYDPATSAMVTVAIGGYLYDSTGHLRAEWDPRVSPALKTRYTYDANGRMATYTAAGRATWSMSYDSVGRLADVSVPDPVNGVATQSLVYDIPVSGSGSPLDLSSAQTATWNQTADLPYVGAAVFPASRVPATGSVNGVNGVHTPSAADWPYASLIYADVSGRTVNTASYGAGAWQVDATRYDASNNAVWYLSAGNRARALSPTDLTDPHVAAQSSSAARADLLATISKYSGDGVDLLTTLMPAHQIHLASGAWASVRVKTANTYDVGAPNSGTFHLVTTSTTSSVPLDGSPTVADDTRKTITGYDPIDGASSTGDTSGWVLRAPTTTTTVMGASPSSTDIVRKTRYDAAGRTVETRMPESTGTDAGTTLISYYTAGTSAASGACRSKPQWAGAVCQSEPAAQPSGTTIASTLTTYALSGAVASTVETSGTTTRTTANTYDGAGRVSKTAITVSPATDGGTALPDVTYGYDPATGDATSWSTSGVTMSAGYNLLGEQTSFTDADGASSTTTYTIDGQVATLNDSKGTYTYTYDGTDAAGKSEHRGLITAMNVGMGSLPSTFTAAYDSDTNMIKKVYPNGINVTTGYDDVGVARSLHYTNRGYNWMFYDQGFDRDDHAVWSTGPIGETDYGYDNANRLIKVQDQLGGRCTTRRYTFSKNGNRTALATSAPAGDGSCQSATSTTDSSSYDAADRATTTGYEYDKFGRTTTVPSTDASGGSTVTTGYYSNDMVASQTQATRAKTFTLDPVRRIRQATDTTSGTETRRIVNHYSGPGDSPAWIAASTDTGSTWSWQRNVTGIDGTLAAVQDSTGTVQIQLTNLHGDVVATVDDDVNAIATNTYIEQTEYGTPRADNSTTPRYGWLGSAQRSTDAIGGLILMGVRLYNPTTGRFLSRDPVTGGNENTYVYPNDPINSADPQGTAIVEKFFRHLKELRACNSLGTKSCVIIVHVSIMAYSMVQKNIAYGNKSNAVQHFIWQVAMVVTLGYNVAKSIGDVHESGQDHSVGTDSWRDLQNNIFSRNWALDHLAECNRYGRAHGLDNFLHWLFYAGSDLYNKGYFTRLKGE